MNTDENPVLCGKKLHEVMRCTPQRMNSSLNSTEKLTAILRLHGSDTGGQSGQRPRG